MIRNGECKPGTLLQSIEWRLMTVIRNGECKPGTLLQSIESGTSTLAFQPGPKFDYDRGCERQTTKYFTGDFFVWLQADLTAPSYYCFCLHAQTGRILSMSTSCLEIVNLEGEVK